MRRHLLTQDLLDLPKQMAELTQTLRDFTEAWSHRLGRIESDAAELKNGQARLESNVAELKSGQARLESDATELKNGQARLEQRMDRVEGRVGNLEGGQYERKSIAKIMARAQNQLGVSHPYPALTQEGHVESRFTQAVQIALNNRRLDADDSDKIHDADLIISGDNSIHVLVEASLGADENDVARAKERADIWAEATGDVVIPVVPTPEPSPQLQETAVTNGVTLLAIRS